MTTETNVIAAPTASIFDLFETDQDMQKNGVWVTFGKYGKVKVAYAGDGNPRYIKAMESTFREHRRAMALGAMPEGEARDLLMKVIAETIVLDWDLLDKSKQPIPYSAAAVLAIFKKLPALFEEIRTKSNDWQNFRLASLEADAGN